MSGAGDLKNSIQSLKRTLFRNGLIQKMNLTLDHFQQTYLQKHNPQIFLKLTHYIMIQYSPILYAKILEKFPNIKLISDKEFLNGCYVCIREFFDTFPSLTTDQFCTSKFLELKVRFVDELINLVLIWLSENKKVKVGKEEKGGKVGKAEKITKKVIQDLQEYEEPRKINVKATILSNQIDQEADNLQKQQPKSLKFKPQSQYQHHQNEDTNETKYGLSKYLNKNSQTKVSSKYQTNNRTTYQTPFDQKPISSKYAKQSTYLQQQPILLKPSKTYPEQKSISYDLENHPEDDTHQQNQSLQSQINDLFELVGNVSLTVNELVGKFNVFQDNVSGWVKNMNAKVDILESTVKTIKDNL